MTSESRPRRIVVGYDGSPAARAALERAAERAGDDGQIHVVCAYALPGDWLGMPNYQQQLDIQMRRAEAIIDGAQATIDQIAAESGSGIVWERQVIGGLPARVIAGVASANNADEIVIGTRGFGRARALLGSVAHELIHLAECPITVIPERVVDRAEALAATGVPS